MSLKSRIDETLVNGYVPAPDWNKPVIGRSDTIRSFYTRYNGNITNALGFQVPTCTVRFWVSVQQHYEQVDVQDEVDNLITLLDTVEDCYPEQEDVEVSYESAGDTRRSKYIVAEVVCNGA